MRHHLMETLLLFAAFFLPGFLWQEQPVSPASGELALYILQFLCLALPQCLLLVYILWIQGDPPLAYFGLSRPRLADLLYGLIIFLGLLAILIVVSLLMALLPKESQELFRSGFRWRLDQGQLIPLVLVFSLVTGYREELFFRSYLISRFSQMGSGPVITLLASSLLFSLGHLYQGVAGFLLAFIQGLFLGIVFLNRKNIHALALAHGIYNATILTATFFQNAPDNSLPGVLPLFIIIVK